MAKRKIEVVIAGDAKSLSRAFGKGGQDAKQFGQVVGSVSGRVSKSFAGMAASAAKFAAVSAGFYGVARAVSGVANATVDFDKAMRNVNSIAQLSEKRLGTLEKQVLKLAGKTAQAPQTLAEGLYDLVSSGFNSSQSMKILAASAKAATAGLTTTEVSTKAVAAVLNAYHRPAADAANVSDVLFQTVNKGVISFDELASTIGDVLPFASSLGVSVNQVGASISTMTKAGISAPETMTRIKSVMEAFIKPSDDMAKAIKATGASSGEALVKQKGFQGALEATIGTTDKSKGAVAKLFPNIRALGGALALTGRNANGAEKDLRSFKDVTGATDTALKEQKKSISYAWSEIKSKITAASISVGSAFIPAVADGFGKLEDLGKRAGQLFKDVKSKFKGLRDGEKQPTAAKRQLGPDYRPAKALGTVGAIGKMVSDGFNSIDWNAIGNKMSEGMSAAFDFTGKLPGLISTGITASIDAIDTHAVGAKFAGVFVEALGTIADPGFWLHHLAALFSVVTFVIPLGKILKIPGFSFLFRYISKPIFDAVAAVGRGLLSLFGRTAAEAGVGFLVGLERLAPKTANVILRLVTISGKGLARLPGVLKGYASRAGSAVASAIASKADSVGEAVGRIAGRIIKGIAAITAPARARMAKVGSAIVSPIHNLGSRFVELGKNLIQGLINGIKAKAGEVANAAKNVAKGAVDGVKGFLGIKSPSKVFFGLGENTIQGYVNGLLSKKESLAAGLSSSLLYPLDATIQALNDKKDKLQAAWDAMDQRAQRSDLVKAVKDARNGTSGGGGGSYGGGSGGSSSGLSGATKGIKGGGAAGKIFSFFRTHGFSDAQAAGWVGNFSQESGLNPGAIEPGGPGRGLAQWGGGRFTALQKFAAKRGTKWTNMNTQLAFVLKELAGPEAAAGKAIKGAHSIDAATGTIGTKYERFGIKGNRSGPAHSAYKRFAGKVSGSSYTSSGSGSQDAADEAKIQKKIDANNDRLDKLREEKRNLATGKKTAARRRELANEIADTVQSNRKLRAALRGAKQDDSKQNAIADAKKALKDFDVQAQRTKELAKFDIKIKGLEQLKAYKDAISGVKDQMKDLAGQAAQTFRTMREGQIDKQHDSTVDAIQNTSPQALELAGLQAQDKVQQDAKDWQDLQDSKAEADQAVADADRQRQRDGSKAYKDEWERAYQDALKKQTDAADAIDTYKRKKREDELTDSINNAVEAADRTRDKAKDGLDDETTNFQNNLQTQLDLLNGNLEQRKISYAQWARSVNDILKPYGLSAATDAGTESALTAGPGALAPATVNGNPIDLSKWVSTTWTDSGGTWFRFADGHTEYQKKGSSSREARPFSTAGGSQGSSGSQKKRAVGGWVYPGQSYTVGELGPEPFTPMVPGRITQASQARSGSSSGGNVIVQGDLVVKRSTDADRIARKLAWQLK